MVLMEFTFHVTSGQELLDDFWEARGLDRSKERLLFAGYSQGEQAHTVYLRWTRSHTDCTDVFFGVDARPPSEVLPKRKSKEHRLRVRDLRDFVAYVRTLDIYNGVRARYGYPWERGFDNLFRLPRTRPLSLTFEVLDEDKGKRMMKITYQKEKRGWIAIVEPSGFYPLPEGKNFFRQPYDLGCSLGKSFRQEDAT